MISKGKVVNYKGVYMIEVYNFDFGYFSIRVFSKFKIFGFQIVKTSNI
jgi:hypothetical protein